MSRFDRHNQEMQSLTSYLELNGLGSHAHVFEDNEIDMDQFFQLRDEHLRILLPGRMGPRLRILRLIIIQNASVDLPPPILPNQMENTIQIVQNYLASIDQGHHFNVFEANEIGLEEFLELSEQNLNELLPGILGAQIRIFELIQMLRAEQDASQDELDVDVDANDPQNPGDDEELRRARRNATIRRGLIIGGAGLGAAAAAVVAAPLVIAGAGFGAAGVAAGSIAAAWQSSIGAVAAGSLFASLQSAGAAGLAVSTSVAIAGTSGTVAGGVVLLATRPDEEPDTAE